jgi:deoxyribodipyrimidine photo-lyase
MVEWAKIVDDEPDLLEISPDPKPNDAGVRQHEKLGKLFEGSDIPDQLEGFEVEDAEQLKVSWPEGIDKAREVLLTSPLLV